MRLPWQLRTPEVSTQTVATQIVKQANFIAEKETLRVSFYRLGKAQRFHAVVMGAIATVAAAMAVQAIEVT